MLKWKKFATNDILKPLHKDATKALAALSEHDVRFLHLKRHLNKPADRLANLAMDLRDSFGHDSEITPQVEIFINKYRRIDRNTLTRDFLRAFAEHGEAGNPPALLQPLRGNFDYITLNRRWDGNIEEEFVRLNQSLRELLTTWSSG